MQGGSGTVGLMISHLLDPVPTEVHVFFGLWAETPLYVTTVPNRKVWLVDSGKIKLLER